MGDRSPKDKQKGKKQKVNDNKKVPPPVSVPPTKTTTK